MNPDVVLNAPLSFIWGPLQKSSSHIDKHTKSRPSQTHAVSLFGIRASSRWYELLKYVFLSVVFTYSVCKLFLDTSEVKTQFEN